MPTYRKLHVKTAESLDINEMPDDFTRLLWVLLPLALCREGRGVHNNSWVKSRVFPLREDVNQAQIAEAMQWYEQHDMIVPYSADGRDYFYVPTFHKYQGNTEKEAKTDYPPPPDWPPADGSSTPESVKSKSRVSQEPAKSQSVPDADADADTDADAAYSSATSADYQEIRQVWLELFPKKPKPRTDNSTLQAKVKTRIKSEHFRENWRPALQQASRSQFLNEGSWFNLGWFLKNDDNYEKCLDGAYDGGGARASPDDENDISRFTDSEFADFYE